MFGDAMDLAGDYDLRLELKAEVYFPLNYFLSLKKFYEHGNCSCKTLISEKYISEDTLVMKSLKSLNDISFLLAKTY